MNYIAIYSELDPDVSKGAYLIPCYVAFDSSLNSLSFGYVTNEFTN